MRKRKKHVKKSCAWIDDLPPTLHGPVERIRLIGDIYLYHGEAAHTLLTCWGDSVKPYLIEKMSQDLNL